MMNEVGGVHQQEALLTGESRQAFKRRRRMQRLFDEDMLAGSERTACDVFLR